MNPKGVLMYCCTNTSTLYTVQSVIYRHRIKGSQQAYLFCGEKDAAEYAAKRNLVIQHKEKEKK